MSDLANSCEHLTGDKLCAILSESPKAEINRQLKCKNSQNVAGCCYLCSYRFQCAISCKYLGQYENAVVSQYVPESTCPVADVKEFKVESLQFESVPIAFCFSCNVEMTWAKTQFTVDNWKGVSSLLISGKVLPVTVLLCPKCGKIEFKAVADVLEKR